MFEGEKIQVEGPKYIKKKSELALPSYASGSSVSTALAAGLGSLCLFLARMANESDRQAERFCERSTMLAVFREMQVSPKDKVIAPSQLFANFGRIFYGTDPRPVGLDKFEFSYFEEKIGAGLTTRRARSRERATGATGGTV
ncbi:uncharacterized protein A1O5_04141 [Cladophialophora psammophila CBS 110553]|uniref:Peptidase S8/S53 domain-containing protein n=1 Tax=Cladophialophora psammophila CBS 110553 TaxID=1182543 RepID=W9WXQ6_9EURO|nr:uncharacterized protein A1O5_04141 [Cladophialophora psammophila CBS 110553]EXJ72992.1 hypothetical protein A1O5_04141 [Cladophialophora psammophila CBS 110553]